MSLIVVVTIIQSDACCYYRWFISSLYAIGWSLLLVQYSSCFNEVCYHITILHVLSWHFLCDFYLRGHQWILMLWLLSLLHYKLIFCLINLCGYQLILLKGRFSLLLYLPCLEICGSVLTQLERMRSKKNFCYELSISF